MGQAFVPILDHIEEKQPPAPFIQPTQTGSWAPCCSPTWSPPPSCCSDVGDAAYRNIRSAYSDLCALQWRTPEDNSSMSPATARLTCSTAPPKLSGAPRDDLSRSGRGRIRWVRGCGVHTGELERDGMNITGMTVHIGARVERRRSLAEVLVSGTVRDLVVGSGLTSQVEASMSSKACPAPGSSSQSPTQVNSRDGLPQEESMQTPLDRDGVADSTPGSRVRARRRPAGKRHRTPPRHGQR